MLYSLQSIQIIIIRLLFRVLSNSVTAFNLPTAYHLQGRANVSDEDDNEKVLVDTKTADFKEYTQIQLEDIVRGWIKYINKSLRIYQNKVTSWNNAHLAIKFLLTKSILHKLYIESRQPKIQNIE